MSESFFRVSKPGAKPQHIEVIDCTLRDGEQTPGVWFTLEEKLQLAQLLSNAGVDILDAGFPASSAADREALQEMRKLNFKARIGATARPLPRDVAAAAEAKADEVFLFMPTSELRLKETLNITRDRANAIFRAGAEDVVSRGMGLNLVFEDATRADPDQMIRLVNELRPIVPIARLFIADTVGCATPFTMKQLIQTLNDAFDGDISIAMHAHNDFGLAGANTLAGIEGGARAISCTVNGIGERAGNADLAECAAGMTHLLGVEHHIDGKALVELSRLVEKLSGIHTSPTKPVTGFNVYRHESGVHVDGMLKDPRSYEFLAASWVGRQSEYVLGKHSGTALIRRLMAEAGIPCEPDTAQKLLDEVKQDSERRDKAEHRRAFERKEAFGLLSLSGIDPATILARHKESLRKATG